MKYQAKKKVPSSELITWIEDKVILLDCGHQFRFRRLECQVGYSLIVHPDGTTECSECGY